jgi:glutaconate CoA-transferase subunit B
MIIMNHEKRRFVEKTDYITSPGYLNGPGSREKAGLPPGTGPYKVYTTRGTFDFDDKTKRMRVFALNPGVTVDDVIENTGFELIIPSKIRENEPPSHEELKILREEVDPYRIILGRGEA